MPTHTPAGRILVPLDGSQLAEAILPLLELTGHPWGSEVLLIRSVTQDSPPEHPAEKEAFHYLAVQSRRLERAGLRVRYDVWHGDPSHTIVNAAVLGRIGLIAMTTHGWRGLDRLRFGSVAESVVRAARVPVLLVRGPLRWPADRPPRMLVPLDGSEQSAAIMSLVARLQQPLQAIVELCHVLEVPPFAASPEFSTSSAAAQMQRAAASDYLERVAARLAGKTPKVERVVLEGPAAATITERIEDGGADLVVMATHGRTGMARLVMGSVAEKVLRKAEVPVLIWNAPIPPGAAHRARSPEEALHDA